MLPFGLTLDTLSFLVFLLAVLVYIVIDRKKIEFHGPLLIRKTMRGRNFIIKTGQSFPRFWSWVGNAAVLAGFFAGGLGIFLFAGMFIDSIVNMAPAVGAGLVLPSPVAVVGGGFIGVPLWFWLVSIISLLIVHEGMHGITAVSQKMKIKNLGWILLAVLPMGAFVEPDEKDVKNKKTMPQLRFFAAGSFANFVLAFLIGLVITPLVLGPFLVPAPGVQVYPQSGMPFAQSEELRELTGNFSGSLNTKLFITGINGIKVSDYDGLREAFKQVDMSPGEVVSLSVDVYYGNSKESRVVNIEAAEDPDDPSSGYIGILFSDAKSTVVKDEFIEYRGVLFFFAEMFQWMIIINLGVGVFNMLPIGPLDGKRMWALVLQKAMPKRHRPVMRAIELITLFLLLAIIVPAIVSNFI